ncbi:MAG: glycosyl transferase family 1, partial [Gardnerella vaginalis]
DFKVQMDDLLAGKIPSLTQPGYKIAQSRSIQQVGQQLKSCYQLALNCVQNI